MSLLGIVSIARRTIVWLPCGAPPSASIVETMLKCVFPGLQYAPFSLSVEVAADRYEQYSPECAGPIILHQPGDITADVETGPRVYCDMIRSRAGTPVAGTPNKSRKRSAASTPNSASNGGVPADDVIESDCLQSVLREWCFRRDQACVITGAMDGLDCAHILAPSYSTEWFVVGDRRRLCAFLPMVAGRTNPGIDVRNAVMMSKDVHSLFDEFKFSIFPEGDKFKVFQFFMKSLPGMKHGAEIITPRIDERFQDPRYYADLFPDKEVFLEHFRQAVLFNAQGAADFDQFSDDDDCDSVDPMEWNDESSDSLDGDNT
ncbi:hypothetical protein BC832DRAFT_274342 [Gaertneriomyces semiglobifer]|nr:hypothetical protein BC832DRAFT_274342 [Gaertneriomyces semiglobifer]